MDQIVVKLEDQNNGEILLYYVDENGDNQEGVLTTIENIENSSIQLQDNSYILGNLGDIVEEEALQTIEAQNILPPPIEWTDEDIKRLLIFYNDNKTSFISGATQIKHLWTVACKTMLIGKNQEACQTKLDELKKKYCEVRSLVQNGLYAKWPYFDMCHQIFHDDKSVIATLGKQLTKSNLILNQEPKKEEVVSVRHMNIKTVDEKVVEMLKLYIKYKNKFQKEYWRRDLWDMIAKEMGETDGEYLQKRFLNYKQRYLQILEKKMESDSPISWPYMNLFDQIFKDDAAFHKKYFNSTPQVTLKTEQQDNENVWDNTQITVLAKYYFESYNEFEDPTIPKKFLWTEIGRLIEKNPDTCKAKFFEMKEQHLQKYIQGSYNKQTRVPVDIIYDHIISKDIQKQFNSEPEHDLDPWKTEEIDELVQFVYDNLQLFKDPICHYVCWGAIATKLKRDIESCKQQWLEFTTLYNSLLDSKKDNPDAVIDWRYIEMFDCIFEFGMDVKLLKGFDENANGKAQSKDSGKIGVRKLKLEPKNDSDKDYTPELEKQSRIEPRTDPKSTKILEYYLKNKEKFQQQKNKISIWDPLAKEIDMSSTQCSHRFRYLKQAFIEFVQKEMKQPKVAITWPYFMLCKKIFGYRTIKNKIKQGQINDDDWMAREIKRLISYFSKNYHEINSNIDDLTKWLPLATELGKTAQSCKEKFVELRKCYRKFKTMRRRNADLKISWSYFDMFDRIYSLKEPEIMEVEALTDDWTGEVMEEDDYQCIIVLPEGQELSDIENAQIILTNNQDNTVTVPENLQNKWTKRTKKLLLIHYINYIRMHRGKEIVPKDMWAHIAAKTNKTPKNCRKMFLKLKRSFKNATESTKQSSPFTKLLEKVLKLKPKFAKVAKNTTFKNVELPDEKIAMALNYYLEHIEDFLNPKFEKKYLWNELANHISEPINKVHRKLNYLKQIFITKTEDISSENSTENIPAEFSEILKKIIEKEKMLSVQVTAVQNYSDYENKWSDNEITQLLNWYLSNLDKFKNPKFDRTYLWLEAASILMKHPVICSKKMTEIRTQYRNMVKQNCEELKNWKFLELCQKIYGTGRKES